MRSLNIPVFILHINITYCRITGFFKRSLKYRRSRYDWPQYDNAYLWYGEEAYEYNHSGTDDEYMDVLGTIMILQVFHSCQYHNRVKRKMIIDRNQFKLAVIRWWLKQFKRGRPNLPLKDTYYHFLKAHRLLQLILNKT